MKKKYHELLVVSDDIEEEIKFVDEQMICENNFPRSLFSSVGRKKQKT